MAKIYHAVPTTALTTHNSYVQPPELPEVTHVNDPALSVMVDFKYHKPPTIYANQSLADAIAEMKLYNMPLLVVIDAERKILGIVTSDDALGEKPVKLIQERLMSRSEIEVGMIMTPDADIDGIDIEDLHHAKVGHIIQTFRDLQQIILFVYKIDPETKQQLIRGLFSASLISRQLDNDINSLLSDTISITDLQHDLKQ